MTRLSDVIDQVQEFWSPIFQDQLIEDTLIMALVNKVYETDLVRPLKGGDRVRVSQISRPTATRKTIGTDSDSFNSSKIVTTKVDLKLTDRVTAAYELEDLTELLTQLKDQNSKIRQSLFESIDIDMNNFIYEKVATGSGEVVTAASLGISTLRSLRKKAAQKKWKRDEWWLLADPEYYSDLMGEVTLTTSDSGATDTPVIGGRFGIKRFGFSIIEDNSDGLLDNLKKVGGVKAAIAFHSDFLLSAASPPEFKLSDLHSNKQHGFLLSVNAIMGNQFGNEGAAKHIVIREP